MYSIEVTLEQIINKQMSQDELPVHPESVSRAHLVFSAMVARRFGGYRVSLMSSEVLVAGSTSNTREAGAEKTRGIRVRPGDDILPHDALRHAIEASRQHRCSVEVGYNNRHISVDVTGRLQQQVFDELLPVFRTAFYKMHQKPEPRYPAIL